MICQCDYCRQDRVMGDRYHAHVVSLREPEPREPTRGDRLTLICIPCLCLLAAFGVAVSWWCSP